MCPILHHLRDEANGHECTRYSFLARTFPPLFDAHQMKQVVKNSFYVQILQCASTIRVQKESRQLRLVAQWCEPVERSPGSHLTRFEVPTGSLVEAFGRHQLVEPATRMHYMCICGVTVISSPYFSTFQRLAEAFF